MKKSAKMNMLHRMPKSGKSFVIKEEKPDILCSSKVNPGFSSLIYKYITSSGEEINKAFDLLFEEVINVEIKNK